MNDENMPDQREGSLGRLAMGTRLLIRYGRDTQEIEVITNRGGIYAVKMIGWNSWREIMTEAELLRRDAVILEIASAKKPSWWRRFFGNDAGTQRGRDSDAPPATETQSRPSLK
jgi:hypothetical protein